MISQEMPLIFAGFQHEILSIPRHLPMTVSDQKTSWRKPLQHMCQHAGRRGLAMCAGHGYGTVMRKQFTEKFIVPVVFDTRCVQRLVNFWIAFVKCKADDDRIPS